MAAFIGRVWSDGDRFLLLDAADAQAWAPSYEQYEQHVVEAASRRELLLQVGEGEAFLLVHEAGEGPLEGAIQIRSGAVAVLRSAVPWSEASEEDALTLALTAGRYVVREGQLDTNEYGLDVWRVAPAS